MKVIDILIVDDDADKVSAVRRLIEDSLGSSRVRIQISNCYIDACERLEEQQYELLILDLLIPREDGGALDADLALSILRSFSRSINRLQRPRYLVGLTGVDDALEKHGGEFAEHGWLLRKYESGKYEWMETIRSIAEHALMVMPAAATAASEEHFVIILHGINDFGAWQSTVKDLIEVNSTIRGFTVKYGRFSVLRFIFSTCIWDFSSVPRKRIESQFLALRSQRPFAKISVIAHSFGTHLITRVLLNNPDFRVHRLIFCGSVVKQDFPWERIRHQVSDPGGTSPRVVVVNECGSSDCWPVFAKCLGYGSIGTHGAGHVLVADRFHKGGHGLYFDPEFIDEYWRSYLETGSIENGREVARSGLAWYFWPFEVLPPWLLLIGFAGLVWLSLYALMLAW